MPNFWKLAKCTTDAYAEENSFGSEVRVEVGSEEWAKWILDLTGKALQNVLVQRHQTYFKVVFSYDMALQRIFITYCEGKTTAIKCDKAAFEKIRDVAESYTKCSVKNYADYFMIFYVAG